MRRKPQADQADKPLGQYHLEKRMRNIIETLLPETSPTGHPNTRLHILELLNWHPHYRTMRTLNAQEVESALRNILRNQGANPSSMLEVSLLKIFTDDVYNSHTERGKMARRIAEEMKPRG